LQVIVDAFSCCPDFVVLDPTCGFCYNYTTGF